MRVSKTGETVGITLRLPKTVLAAYSDIANRANMMALQKGQKATTTVQDVMRHRLASLPWLRDQAAETTKPSGAE